MNSSKHTKKTFNISFKVQGNLTGIPRRIKDSVADIYNSIQKWNKLNTQGFEQLSKVSDIKLSLFVPTKEGSMTESYRYSDELDTACKSLRQTFDEMEVITVKMSKISEKLLKLTELEDMSLSTQSEYDEYPFRNWPTMQFYEHTNEITQMHVKELEAKRCIVEHAAHVDLLNPTHDDVGIQSNKCRDILMTYSSCWLHEPFINENIRTLFTEEMLFESGHNE